VLSSRRKESNACCVYEVKRYKAIKVAFARKFKVGVAMQFQKRPTKLALIE